jgi:hypothetical protein
MSDLLPAQGFGPGSTEAINDMTVPVEVWVDRDGLVRRMSFEYRFDEVTPLPGPESGPYRPDIAVTLDLFDYGDESIRVELPADAIDITETFRDALESTPAARGE